MNLATSSIETLSHPWTGFPVDSTTHQLLTRLVLPERYSTSLPYES